MLRIVRCISGTALLAAGTFLVGCASSGAEPKSPNEAADEESTEEAAEGTSSEGGGVGQPAPSFVLSPPGGGQNISLDELRGKVVVVDFWATWCDPCKESFPGYQRLTEEFGDDLVVVGVSVDEEPDGIEAFGKETGVSFALVWDEGGGVAEKYSPPKMPTSYVLDQSGVVRHVHAGYHDGEEDELRQEIAALVNK
jgi:peroxiredoxin